MSREKNTTMRVRISTIRQLRDLEIHPKESNDEIIGRILLFARTFRATFEKFSIKMKDKADKAAKDAADKLEADRIAYAEKVKAINFKKLQKRIAARQAKAAQQQQGSP